MVDRLRKLEGKATYTEVARVFGTSEHSIRAVCQQHGIRFSNCREPKFDQALFDKLVGKS